AAGRHASDIGIVFMRLTADVADVDPQPHIAATTNGWNDLEPGANTGGGGVILVERLARAHPRCRNAGKLRRGGPCLEISERRISPRAAPYQAQAGVSALAPVGGEGSAAFALIGEAADIRLKFRVGRDPDDAADRCRCLLIGSGAVGRTARRG